MLLGGTRNFFPKHHGVVSIEKLRNMRGPYNAQTKTKLLAVIRLVCWYENGIGKLVFRFWAA